MIVSASVNANANVIETENVIATATASVVTESMKTAIARGTRRNVGGDIATVERGRRKRSAGRRRGKGNGTGTETEIAIVTTSMTTTRMTDLGPLNTTTTAAATTTTAHTETGTWTRLLAVRTTPAKVPWDDL